MKLSELKNNEGARKTRIRVGRGIGCGKGKTSGRGHKGQKARSGYSRKIGFEGGQMPLQRRMPKRGFNNAQFTTEYSIINLGQLNVCENGTVITPQSLVENGIVKQYKGRLKVLGDGELKKKIEIHAHKFSASALEQLKKLNLKWMELN
ncbi:MAG: 50S ribosomal protein L15 [Candidatus Auribacterota bacterium]|jgi:large subunit ribosomal protein L15|uniref:Large ribosomal subunit protein uL15 n=1 Tax=Candidatus Auribacter fodinae TaxID=2093366 RepID=A0A3A4QWV5_9BACT|nr:MAG: 50S ribosomal protein L15 [Candidatus Auribacter fodinae]